MKSIIILACAILSLSMSYAQEIARSRSCQDLSLNPTLPDGHRPLAQFWDQVDIAGFRDCWVHEDASGKNRVITPYYWGEVPDDFNMPYIRAAFQAMAKSRRVLAGIGSANNTLAMTISEVRPDTAEAFWPLNNTCYMEASYAYIQGISIEHWQQTVAHETGHCVIMESFSGYNYTNYDDADKWWDESTAEWLSAVVYPRTNAEHYSARNLDIEGVSFRQPYNGFIVLDYYAQRFGNARAWQFIEGFSRLNNMDEYFSYLESNQFTSFYLDFLTKHFEGKVVDAGGGFYPREADVLFHASSPLSLSADNTSFTVNTVQEGRGTFLSLTIPEGYNAVFKMMRGERVLGALKKAGRWETLTQDISIEGSCDNSVSADLLLTHMIQADQNVVINYELTQRDDCGCNTTNPRVDQCLVGTWTMDTDSVRDMLIARFGDQPVQVHEYHGEEIMTNNSDGTGSNTFSWRLDGTSTDPRSRGTRVRMQWSGNGTFKYGNQGKNLCGQQTSHNSNGTMTITLPTGQSFTMPMSDNSGSANPLELGEVVYECSATQIKMDVNTQGEHFTVFYNRVR